MKSVRSCACVGGAAAAAASTADDLLEVVSPLSSPLPRFGRFAVESTRRAQTGLQLGAPQAKPAAEVGRCHRILLPAPREVGRPTSIVDSRKECGTAGKEMRRDHSTLHRLERAASSEEATGLYPAAARTTGVNHSKSTHCCHQGGTIAASVLFSLLEDGRESVRKYTEQLSHVASL